MRHPPRSIDVTQVTEWRDGQVRRSQDYLVAEEPLEIRLGITPLSVTMRTPGQDLELAAGFLFTEGFIQKREQMRSLEYAKTKSDQSSGNIVQVELRDTSFEKEEVQRNFYTTSSCGICGKASIEAVRAKGIRRPNPEFFLDPAVLCRFPEQLKAAQSIFERTGGLHAAGLFNASGHLLALREDVGRHNAVDKIVGWAMLEGRLPLADCALMVSGRGGFEIIQKALMAGVPLLASVSAPSGLAVRLARETGMTLVGFLRGVRFLVYSGEERLQPVVASSIGNTDYLAS
ncbi:MAG TPA: formate dehydrogenase accessory sulfurtransferase FdhD [Terriglobales bacterium]|nr:formate dehydrogenase accessory sulfurtransferase FdhD [Terriglobales bacterium]